MYSYLEEIAIRLSVAILKANLNWIYSCLRPEYAELLQLIIKLDEVRERSSFS